MPPAGWAALLPNKTADAGGAMQCVFEKHVEEGQQQVRPVGQWDRALSEWWLVAR